MKIECKDVEKLISQFRIGELESDQLNEIRLHAKNCPDCLKLYEIWAKTEAVIAKLARSVPSFPEEEKLTGVIINQLKDAHNPPDGTILDDLIKFVSGRAVRFAMGAALILTAASFFYMEYSDIGKMISLEEKMSRKWNNSFNYSSVFGRETDFLNFIYNSYKLADGKTSYLELNSELILMKKKDLRALFEDYEKFDESTKMRLDEMRNGLLRNGSTRASEKYDARELRYLRKEVERLNKELEEIKFKRGLK